MDADPQGERGEAGVKAGSFRQACLALAAGVAATYIHGQPSPRRHRFCPGRIRPQMYCGIRKAGVARLPNVHFVGTSLSEL